MFPSAMGGPLVSATALVAILGAAAGLAVPRDTGGPMGMEGFRQVLLATVGAWGWIGAWLGRLAFRSRTTLWAFRFGIVASLVASLPNAVAAPPDCLQCFRSPQPGDYRLAAVGIALLWLGALVLEGKRAGWSLRRSALVERWLRLAAWGWLGISLLAILPILLRSV